MEVLLLPDESLFLEMKSADGDVDGDVDGNAIDDIWKAFADEMNTDNDTKIDAALINFMFYWFVGGQMNCR